MESSTREAHELCGDSSVMPGLPELCGGVVMPPSAWTVRFGSNEISVVASTSSWALGTEKSSVVDAAVSLARESGKHVVPIGDGIAIVDTGEVCLLCWLKWV
jgi:hypothetical protein